MHRLSDFHGIGPITDRPSAAAAHALRADASHLALSWTDSDTGTLYGLSLDGSAWVAIGGGGGGGGATTFLGLADTPDTYAGQANKLARVNGVGTAIDFVTAFFHMLAEAPAGAFSLGANKMLVGNAEGTAFVWQTPPAGISGPSLVLPAPTLSSGGYTTIIIDSQKASGLINSVGGDDGVNCRLIQNAGLVTNGPTGHQNYYNVVFGLCSNGLPSFTPANTALPSMSYRIESKFAQGAPTDPFIAEFHTALFPASDPSIEFRAYSATVPHLIADWNGIGAGTSQRGNYFRFISGVGDDRITMHFGALGNDMEFLDAGVSKPHPKLIFGTNNRAVAEQRNAANNALVPLVYRNQHDNFHLGGGALYIATPSQSTPSGDTAGFVLNLTTGATNGTAMRIYIPTIASGDFNVQNAQGSVAGKMAHVLYNTTGSAMLDLRVLNGTAADALLAFTNDGGGGSFTIGYDNSDGDKLKIEKSYKSVGNASNTFVEYDPTTNTSRFRMPVEVMSSTIAGAPSAAGFRHWYFSDAARPGGGTGCPAWSDGANWRRYSDDSIIA
jgi:hypothetical protein